ncbi:NAD(P)-binding protein [Azospira restricta]|uniref:NAD(P)-binding protein n=1 Tax=Azospira restricta TaxID=404405 RepID=A0A974SPC7_9RHOO|nr:NAD(P)-binding protein [Azospira restricta]QRJ63991.1 NAD(P)-binding protein [Azospira restricta]
MRRRAFLGAAAALSVAPLAGCAKAPPLPPGELLGASPALGHRLRDGGLPAPSATRRVPVLIVGGGVGGLAAAWKLSRAGVDDYLLAEMEGETGGNSRAGNTPAGPCPLGAHYLPLPTREATATRELLAELGVLRGDPRAARPAYDERYLCAAPQERLWRDGLWQEGLLPTLGVGAGERAEVARFLERMAAYRHARGGDGRRAFALPMALSSRDPALLALDRLSMRDWLRREGFAAAQLHWYVDYACRDDYGAGSDAVSAWAGIHYFACRSGQATDVADDVVLTAPDGNAWLARGLAAGVRGPVLTGAVACRVAESGERGQGRSGAVEVDLWLAGEERVLRVVAEQLIWAAPLHLLPHVFAGRDAATQAWLAASRAWSHAPWLVANLTLAAEPETHAGAPLAWDNVLADSPGLGYVVSTHQTLRQRPGPTVLTYYRALSEHAPARGRELLLGLSREAWAAAVLSDLARPHPEIHELTTRLDVVRYGHAMARPTVGFVWGGAREAFAAGHPRIRFAHADVSGFSLFEEAQYRGVLAAERTLQQLGVRFSTSLA